MKTLKYICCALMTLIMVVSQVMAQGTWTQYQPRIARIDDIVVSGNEFWCSSEYSVYKVDPFTMEYEEILYVPPNNIASIEKSPNGDIMICENSPLKFNLYSHDKWKYFQYPELNTDIKYPGAVFPSYYSYDRDGILWFAGHGIGLIRFDGENFTKIPDVEFPQEDRVSSLYAGSDGRIWVGTRGGLYCYDGESWAKLSFRKENPEYIVMCMAEDTDGSLWVGTLYDGILHYKNGLWDQYIPESNGKTYSGTGSLVLDNTGTLWAALVPKYYDCFNPNSTLFSYDGTTWTAYHDPVSDKIELKSLIFGPDGALWAGTFNPAGGNEAGLLRFDGEKWTNYLCYELLPADLNIQDLVYYNGLLLMSTTNKGLYEYDGSTWSQIFKSVSGIRSAAVSPDGIIWAGSLNKLYRYEDLSWKPVSSNLLSDNDNSINQITVDLEGTVWCVTKNGLISFDGSDWKLYGENDGIPGTDISTVAVDQYGSIWVGWNGYISNEYLSGIVVYDGKKWAKTSIGDPSNQTSINKIVFSPSGEAWAVMKRALFRYDGDKWVQIPCNCQQIVDITCDSEGIIYLKTDNGVERYDGKQWKTYTCGDDLPFVCRLAAGDNGIIYGVSLDGSFTRFDPNPLISYVDESSLFPEKIEILGNYPNPFNMSTTVHYELLSESLVDLAIYSVTGQKIRTLVSELKSPGSHSVIWDGRDDFGRVVSSGIYFSRLHGGELSVSKRMMFLK